MEDAVHSRLTENHLCKKEAWIDSLRGYRGRPDNLIPLLQRVQREMGYLPEWALTEIADLLRVPSARVFGVATFYDQFRRRPAGEQIIRVCTGTACHVRGSHRILQGIESRLQIAPGETTKDGRFTLETVGCFGPCALAPVMVVKDTVYGRMNRSKALAILHHLRELRNGPSRAEVTAGGIGRSQWTT